jgi:hypothetical protein
LGPAEANRITHPTLVVLGARSGGVSPAFEQRHQLLLAWLPDAEPFVLPDATHLLHYRTQPAWPLAWPSSSAGIRWPHRTRKAK